MNRTTLFSLGGVLFATALLILAYTLSRPASTQRPLPDALLDVVLDSPRTVEPFTLSDIEQQEFDRSRLKGKWTLLFFGYTHCPDICPSTLATLKAMAHELEKTPNDYTDTRFVFVSVDPQRDTLAHLAEYVRYFHPDFLAATGEKTEIDKLAGRLGAVYMFDGDTAGDDYIVNHSASIAVVDPSARWVARFNPPHKAGEMAEQLRLLRDYLQP